MGPGSPWTTAQSGRRLPEQGRRVDGITECSECNATTTSTRFGRGVTGRTFESVQSEVALAAGNPEVDALCALSNLHSAQERPLKAQLAHTNAFIDRSRFRMKLDQEQEAEMELLNLALQRQAQLREQIAAEPSAVEHPPAHPIQGS